MSFVKVKISGLNLMRIVDRLVSSGVFVNNVEMNARNLKFCIDEKKLNLLNNVCKQERKCYEVVYKNGFKYLFSKIKHCFGFLLAFVICFCFVFSYNGIIFNVDVVSEGSVGLDLNPVKVFLQENGINNGMLKSDYSVDEIQKMIITNFENVASCEVLKYGGNLQIVLHPAVVKNEVVDFDLCSKYNAIISSVEIYSGESTVKVGDVVKKGDVLIKNSQGASGKILGRVYFSSYRIYNQNQQLIEKTGNYKIENNYKIFNKNIFISKNDNKNAIYLVEKCDFYLTKNFFLPIICERVIYYEANLKNVVIPFEDVEDEIKMELFNELKSEIREDVKFDELKYSIVSEGDYTRIDCFFEKEMELI